MRGFRLSRPSVDGGPRRSIRDDAEAEAAAELRRVLEGAGLPPEDATEVLERTAARRPGGPQAAPPAPRPPAPTEPEPVRDEPRPAVDAAEAAGGGPQTPTRRVRKSPPGGAAQRTDVGDGASSRRTAAPRSSTPRSR